MEVDADWLTKYNRVLRALLDAVDAAAPRSTYDLEVDQNPGEYITTGCDVIPRSSGLMAIHLAAYEGGLTLYAGDFPAIEDTLWDHANDFTKRATGIVVALIRGEGKILVLKLGKLVIGRKIFVRIEGEDVLIGQTLVTSRILPFMHWEEHQLPSWS